MMISRTLTQSPRCWQWLALFCVAIGFWATPALAAVQEIRVIGVGIDSLSGAAEEKAIDYAKKRGVYLAARNMGGPDAGFKVAKLKPEVLSQIIRGSDVVQTKREANVTYVEVNITIVEEALRKALKLPSPNAAVDAANAARKTREVLALPVYVGPTHPFVWEKDNLMRQPLAEEVLRQSRGAVLVASGDFDDLRLIDRQNVLTVTADELKPMFERYGTREIVIAVFSPSPEGKETPASVLLRRITPLTTRTEIIEITPDDAKESANSRLNHAVVATAAALTKISVSTSEDELAALAKATPVQVRLVYATSRELGQLIRSIRLIPGVMAFEVPNISIKTIDGTIYFDGDKNLLQKQLIKQTILVHEEAGGWKLSLR